MIEGIKRFRQAIKNQRDLGSGEFRLTYHDAEEIADEIDAELLEICNSAEREIGRYVWVHGVPAPMDADGEVVPLTTRTMYDKDGQEVKISRFSLTNDGFEQNRQVWSARVLTGFIVNLEDLHLYGPDSWERLEEDVGKSEDKGICGYFGFAMNRPCSAECPARDVHDSCAVTALHDVMRRAKALAERDAKEA